MRLWIFAGILAATVGGAAGCAQATHPVVQAKLGVPGSIAGLEASLTEPGPIRLHKVVAADWEVPLDGLLNLEHPRAQHAEIEDRSEPIHIYFYWLEHPQFGDYLVDTGVARSVAQRSEDMPVGWLVRQAMNWETLVVHTDTRSWLEQRDRPLAGVFLTHMHLDHILGLQDIPKQVPIYVGPGEVDQTQFQHLFSQSTTDANLEGFDALREWSVVDRGEDPFAVIDVFGDGSLFALHVPGHTAGSMAFVARTTEGPQLITGDGCHTAWGWQHVVEPGTFNAEPEQAADSFTHLHQFASRHAGLRVHLGHQELPPAAHAVHPVHAAPHTPEGKASPDQQRQTWVR